MKEVSIEICENISGGGFCQAVAVADAVVVLGGAASHFGWLALNPVGGTILVAGGVALVGASLYCAFS
ncbi:hypothetical protein LZF95_07060 [Algoriphagus sp. AGSA1]|uniref:hypothetical protein n=1 Tax=Algoriphagus sp. AGSA1 TaxID=2907213 RepID=UPI001F1734B0|nr:hypothetical protein [Algoriphagus sp. AGSA1]MCE7054425.1 hypothetical protein [Algoriphagus sp. AGSA1]